MLPKELTIEVRNRLKSLQGHIGKIIAMMEDEDQDPGQILIQFKAVQKGLEKAHYLLQDEVYRKTLALKIVKAVDACPGNCGYEERIQFIKEQFPRLSLDELNDRLKEMHDIEKKLAND